MSRSRILNLIVVLTVLFLGVTAPAVTPILQGESGPEAEQSSGKDREAGVALDQFVAPTAPREPVSLMGPAGLLGVYSLLIIAASLFGGWVPSKVELTHTRMQTIISLVGGLMLGIGVFHLLPHAFEELHDAHATTRWMMLGIVVMFALMRLFHFHNHEPVSTSESACQHDHDHDHHHGERATGEAHSASECHTHAHAHGLSWTGIAVGLSIHTLIDGLALGASVYADASSGGGFWLFGLGTFLAIVLHKPLDAVSITSLMVASGWTKRSRNAVNIGFSMMCPLGAILFWVFLLGVPGLSGYQEEMVGTALAFAAGVFICISLSDLLPEMEFHSHNKVQLTTALALGIVLAWLMAWLHPDHL